MALIRLRLGPITAGYHGHFDETEKVVEQSRHFRIQGRLALCQCAVQIIDNELFKTPHHRLCRILIHAL